LILYGDLETYSEVPIKHGTYKYAENAEIMLFAYAIDDGPAKCWDRTHNPLMPKDLYTAVTEASRLVFQNSMFDRTVLRLASNSTAILRDAANERHLWYDTMVQALAHSLPGGLEKLCEIMGVPQDQRKLSDGKTLIQLFCKPRPKNQKLRRATRWTHPQEWERFIEYAVSDVEAMRVIYKKMPKWNFDDSELELWHLDQRINDRGFAVDVDLATAAIEAVAREKKRLDALAKKLTSDGDLTGDQLERASQRDKMLKYILEYHGVELMDMKSDTLERRLNDPELPRSVRDLIAVRLEATQTSTSKYAALVRAVNKDGRLRGTLQFAGAGRTARWAGRTFQPQNLTRPTMSAADIDLGIEAIKSGAPEIVFSKVMDVCANAVRGCIVAPPGRKLVVADLSNIEGRVLAWLAGEEWKLDAYRAGEDLYKRTYAMAFAMDPADVNKAQRQIGKVMDLFFGYEGGVGAFLTGAATYGIDLVAMADAARPTIPADIMAEAEGFWGFAVKKKITFGLPREVHTVCESLKRMARRASPNIQRFWWDLASAVKFAIANPGESLRVGHLVIERQKNWLRIRLPSGRFLCYPSPQLNEERQEGDERGTSVISYMGMNQYSKKWSRVKSYGGKFAENVTQAVSRDVMGNAMPLVENAGYEIVLSVHDELLTETPDVESYSSDGLSSLLATNPSWAPDLPLAAAGFETYRYRKD
jgi:DNA polymerase